MHVQVWADNERAKEYRSAIDCVVPANCRNIWVVFTCLLRFPLPLCCGTAELIKGARRLHRMRCRNVAVPPSNMRHVQAASVTRMARTGLSGVGSQRYRRYSSASRDFRLAGDVKSALASSSQDTVEQEPGRDPEAVGAEDADVEARPFPKVGDVVRYEGKWENEVSFGEVSACLPHSLSSGPGSFSVISRQIRVHYHCCSCRGRFVTRARLNLEVCQADKPAGGWIRRTFAANLPSDKPSCDMFL